MNIKVNGVKINPIIKYIRKDRFKNHGIIGKCIGLSKENFIKNITEIEKEIDGSIYKYRQCKNIFNKNFSKTIFFAFRVNERKRG